MLHFFQRLLFLIVLLSVAALWLYAGTLSWRSERVLATLSPVEAELGEDFTGMASLVQARYFLAQSQYAATQVEELLHQALRQRPLYAPAWLDLAELQRRNYQIQKAVHYLEYARSLWPQRPVFLWRVALLLVGLEKIKPALETLASYWVAIPQDGLQVIALARRLQPDPEAWVGYLLQAVNAKAAEPLIHYRYLLRAARNLRDPLLAQTVWAYTPETLQQDTTLLLPYIELLLAEEHYDEAESAWSALTERDGSVYNGSFEKALIDGGLGWYFRDRPGFRIERDRQERRSGDYSLLINFTGSENVNFIDLRHRLIVGAGKRYRLQGYWKGYGLTTRSGVYIEVISVNTAERYAVALDPKYGTWPWESFELMLEVPEDTRLLELRVRRRSTTALDNKIAGKVWLDDFSIIAENSAE